MSEIGIESTDLSDLIGLVYDSALDKNQWQSLISRITHLFPGFFGWTSSFHNEYWLGMYTADGFNELLLEKWDTERTEQDRVFTDMPDELNDMRREQRIRQMPSLGGILKSRDVFSDDELHAFNFYKKKMKPMGIGHWIGLAFVVSGPRYATIAFAEIDAMPVEKDYEGLHAVMELLSPHIVRAMRISRALYLARQAADATQGFLDVIALPLVVCDVDGAMQFGNEAGRRLIARGSVLQLRKNGRITLRKAHQTNWLNQCFRKLKNKNQTTGIQLDDSDGPISLCVVPFHPRMSDETQCIQDVFENRTLFAIFVGTQHEATINAGLLQDVFSLTPREAEVCAHVVTGKSPSEIAQLIGRAEKTIRNQIQSTLEKVGVSTTGALTEALSVFRIVGAMSNADDPFLFTPKANTIEQRMQSE